MRIAIERAQTGVGAIGGGRRLANVRLAEQRALFCVLIVVQHTRALCVNGFKL